MEPTTKKWKTETLKKSDMLQSRPIGKQSGESVESVLMKKRKAAVGRICRKGSFQVWNERVKDDESGGFVEVLNTQS